MTEIEFPQWWLNLSEAVGSRVDKVFDWIKKKPAYRYRVIFRSGVKQVEFIHESTDETSTLKELDKQWELDLSQGWVKKLSRWSRWIDKIKEERWLIYEEDGDGYKLLTMPSEPVISASLLLAVHQFKGVDEGLSDEFSKPGRWDDLPGWVLILLTVIFAVVAIYVGIDAGVIKL